MVDKFDVNDSFEKIILKKEISDIISIILNTAPRKLQEFLFQLHARLNGEESKYNYKTKINFDLINDDIDSLFDKKDIITYKDEYELDLEEIKNVFENSKYRILQRSRVEKYIYRNHYLEAIGHLS